MPGPSRTRRAVAALVGFGVVAVGCGDGAPAFCEDLREQSDLGELAEALERGDLDDARAEAEQLDDLARSAPEDIEADLTALTSAVVELVGLLRTDPVDPDEASELDRRRAELDDELAELDRASQAVSEWALSECGFRLG